MVKASKKSSLKKRREKKETVIAIDDYISTLKWIRPGFEPGKTKECCSGLSNQAFSFATRNYDGTV